MAPRKNRSVSAAELAAQDAPPDAPPADEAPPPAPAKSRKATAARTSRARISPMPPLPGTAIQIRAMEPEDYLPDPKRHMSEVGPVATSNFICRIGSRRISVRMGAPRSTIPQEIQNLMAASGVTFAHAQPPATRGAVVIEDPEEDFGGPPRARRTSRRRDRDPQERPFKAPRSLPVE